MPVIFREVVQTYDMAPIETGDEAVQLRVDILHEEGVRKPYSARIWRLAEIRLHPLEREDEDVTEEFRILIEDETIGGETFEGETVDEVLDQIRHRIRAAWYIPH